MTTETRERIIVTLDRLESNLLDKADDPFAPNAAEDELRVALLSAWSRHVTRALETTKELLVLTPSSSYIETAFSIFHAELSLGFPRTVKAALQSSITAAFILGKAHVTKQYRDQTGKDALAKVDATFGMLFGLTEDHALESLVEQGTLSAGGFWDEQLSTSMKEELARFFDETADDPIRGAVSRETLIDKLQTIVNNKLDILGESSLPRIYFEALSGHFVVRSRNIGSLYRAKALGATKYRLRNPNDKRTSPICAGLTKGQTFELSDGENTVSSILTARNISDLKTKVPFLKPGVTAKDVAGPVPPLHWLCRTWQEFVFDNELEALFADERNAADARDAERRSRIEEERARR